MWYRQWQPFRAKRRAGTYIDVQRRTATYSDVKLRNARSMIPTDAVLAML